MSDIRDQFFYLKPQMCINKILFKTLKIYLEVYCVGSISGMTFYYTVISIVENKYFQSFKILTPFIKYQDVFLIDI